jgi:hypothetical protein
MPRQLPTAVKADERACALARDNAVPRRRMDKTVLVFSRGQARDTAASPRRMDKTVLVFSRGQREMVQREGANMVICRFILLAGRNASSVSIADYA